MERDGSGSPSSANRNLAAVGLKQNQYKFKKARVIIVNFRDYHEDVQKELKVRVGSEFDVDKLEKTFEEMEGFEDVESWTTEEELEDFLENLQDVAKSDFDEYDCFVLVTMAHGREGGIIYNHIGESIKIKDIWGKFTATNCRSLAKKPKLFFFQACRGMNLGKGAFADNESPSKKDYEMEGVSIPVQADIMIFYATFEDTTSIRILSMGSPFIQDLCAVLSEDSKKEDDLREPILTLMTYVCNMVSERTYTRVGLTLKPFDPECKEEALVKQMPTIVSTLRFPFYFRMSPE